MKRMDKGFGILLGNSLRIELYSVL